MFIAGSFPAFKNGRGSLKQVFAYLGLLVVATGVCLAVWQGSPAKANVQTIYVRNLSSYVSDREVRRDLPAFQQATSADFAPLWNIDAKLVFIGVRKAPRGSQSITLVDKGPVHGALAYHEMVDGVADAIVYTGVSKFYGYAWSVGFTHELWEMLVDAPAGQGAVASVVGSDGVVWANEVADAVEADSDGFYVGSVLISDFVTARWYGAEQVGPYDFCGHVQKAFEVRPGGYAQWWDGAGWNVVSNFRKGGLGDGRGFYQ